MKKMNFFMMVLAKLVAFLKMDNVFLIRFLDKGLRSEVRKH